MGWNEVDGGVRGAVSEHFNEECWHFTEKQDEEEIERLKRVVEDTYRAERQYCDSNPERIPDRFWRVTLQVSHEVVMWDVCAKTEFDAKVAAKRSFMGMTRDERVSALGAGLMVETDGDGGIFGEAVAEEIYND